MGTKYDAKGWNDNINLIVYLMIIFSGIGVTWLALNNVESGIRYITVFLVSVAFLVVSFFFVNEHQKDTIKKLIKNPFTSDYYMAAGLFLVGWFSRFILEGFFVLLKITWGAQLMVPLSASTIIEDISQSFAIAEATASPFWKWFIAVFTAGSIEEFAFGFVLMLVGVIIAMLAWRLMFDEKEASSDKARIFYLVFALVFTGLLFGGIHKLNASYVSLTLFIVAIAFRLVMNYSIYFLGIFLSFTLGFHQAHNAVWYWATYGASATVNALLSVGGVMVLVIFLLIIIFALRNIEEVAKRIGSLFQYGRG
ncbi:hypothetical protein ACFL96_13995 [Thermoproteota archaeon]